MKRPIIGPGHCSAPPSAPSLAPARPRDKSGTMCAIGVGIRRLPSLSLGTWKLEFGLQDASAMSQTEHDPSLNRDTNLQDPQHLAAPSESSCRSSGGGSPILGSDVLGWKSSSALPGSARQWPKLTESP
jgi:hypothetical protein